MTQTKAELLQTRHQGDLKLGDADSSHYVGLKAPATVSSNLVWTLPATDGSANQFLKTDGSGTLSWATDSATDSTKMPLAGGTFTGDVVFTGDAANVTWDKSTDDLIFNDNAKAIFGTSSDGVEIFHNGSNSYIKDSGTGNLVIQSNYVDITNAAGNEDIAKFISDGAVELYHNAVKTFNTTSHGIEVLGPEGGTANVYMYADEGDDNADKWGLEVDTSGNFNIRNFSTGSWVDGLTLNGSNNATFAGVVTTAGIDIDGQYQQAVDAITPATTPVVNCALGNFFTLNAASTYPSSGWSFTNVPASCVYSVIIKVTTGGSTTINWNSIAVNGGSASNKIKWNGGAVPAFTAGSPLYIILTTTDTGATWEGTSLIDFATV